uniref:Uncharacterized protein n=1 Tax=Rhizophora mucronata TaxID=61149 RepID=A0A2P2NIA9_RHIMU
MSVVFYPTDAGYSSKRKDMYSQITSHKGTKKKKSEGNKNGQQKITGSNMKNKSNIKGTRLFVQIAHVKKRKMQTFCLIL